MNRRTEILELLKREWPDKRIYDSPDSVEPLLNFIEAEVVHVVDGTVYPYKNWSEEHRDRVIEACKVLS